MDNRILSFFAVLIVLSAVFVGDHLSEDSEATYPANYGTIYEIDLAPGFAYTYSPGYPGDLTVTTSIDQYESTGLTASISGGTLNVAVKDGITSGSYDVILKAVTNTGGVTQTAYQHIRINVVSGLSVSGSINDIIKGVSVNFVPSGSSSMGDVTWTVKSGTTLPIGLKLSNGKVTGTPTQLGKQTVSLTATAAGQSKDLIVDFTVYSKINGGSAQTITSHGNAVSSAAIDNNPDIGVTWAVTSGTIPSGFGLDASTGVISGGSTALQSVTVTITGTSSHGPAQTAIKQVTIRSEAALAVNGPSSLTTFSGAPDRTAVFTASSGTSAITWTIGPAEGVSVSGGTVTVKSSASAGDVIVTAETAYGQTAVGTLSVIKEAAAVISGAGSIGAVAGSAAATGTYICNVPGGTWSVTGAPAGSTVTVENGVLSVSGSAPAAFTVTLHYTTPGGQEAVKDVGCTIVSQLVFDTVPIAGAIAYEG